MYAGKLLAAPILRELRNQGADLRVLPMLTLLSIALCLLNPSKQTGYLKEATFHSNGFDAFYPSLSISSLI